MDSVEGTGGRRGISNEKTHIRTISSKDMGFFYANSEPRPNAKYSCAASVAITR